MKRFFLPIVVLMVFMCVGPTLAALNICLDTGQPTDPYTGAITVDAAAIAATKTHYVRLNFIVSPWSSPTDSTLHNGKTWFQTYDQIVNDFTSRGVKVYGLVSAQSVVSGNGYNTSAYTTEYTNNFVSIVGHFKDRVFVYEEFNEPNDWAGGQAPQLSSTYFASQLSSVYTAVKINHSGDPTWQVTLVSGPLFSFDDNPSNDYMQQTYAACSSFHSTYGYYPFDGIGYHLYCAQGTTDQATVYNKLYGNMSAMWSTITSYEGSGTTKKFWISEFGWRVISGAMTEANQASDLTYAFGLFNDNSYMAPKTALASWFQICDFGVNDQWGLFRTTPYTDANKKASWTAFYNFANAHPPSGGSTGTISGNVKDGGYVAISGATVATTTGGYTTTTDASGNYTLSNVTAGSYTVNASKTGYDTVSTGVSVTGGQTTPANFILNVSGVNGNTPGGTNMATSGTATTDSNYDANYTGAKAIDGINTAASKWCSAGTVAPHWLAIDLGTSRTVNGYVLKMPGQAGEASYYNAKNVKFQSATSLAGPWTDEATIDNSAQANTITRSYITPKILRYVRLYITNAGIDNYSRINEFEVWCASCTLPTITTQPVSQTKTVGQSVTFSVTATNATSYQWKKGGVNISGATASAYTIGSVVTGDAGSYTAAVTNSCGTVTSSAAVLTVNTGGPIASESFTTLPTWTSTFDAAWGSAATFSSVTGGQSGNQMQASRASQGSSAKVKVYAVPTNTNITISIYLKAASYGGGAYWTETSYKMGSNTAQDFDSNSATWTPIKNFSNTGTNGNGNVWTKYTATVNTGANTQISIGYKHGASACVGPTMGWDTFAIN